MKVFGVLIIGLLIGTAVGGGGVWAWQSQRSGQLVDGLTQMQGDGMVLLGNEAAKALNAGSPDALRDFANYVVDSSLIRARSGPTSGAYNDTLHNTSASIPADRRPLSHAAPEWYVAARKQALGQ